MAQQRMSYAQHNAINDSRGRAIKGLQDFFENNISPMLLTLGDVTRAERHIATLRNIENWKVNQEGWYHWAVRVMTQSGHAPIEDFMVPQFQNMLDRIKEIAAENHKIQQIIVAARGANRAYSMVEQNDLAQLATRVQTLFGELVGHMEAWRTDTTLPGDIPVTNLPPDSEQASTVDVPFLDIFTLADNFNTPFTSVLQTSFMLNEAQAKAEGILEIQKALQTNMDYHEIPTRIKLKLNEAMLQATDVHGNPLNLSGEIHALQDYVVNSRTNLAQGGYVPADIYKDPTLVGGPLHIALHHIRRLALQSAGGIRPIGLSTIPATIGFPMQQGVPHNPTAIQNDVVLYLQRWCNQGLGVGSRLEIMTARLMAIEDDLRALAAGNNVPVRTASYNEKVRKLIKNITLSIPNTVPLTRAEFAAAKVIPEPKQWHPNAQAPAPEDVEMVDPEAINTAYDAYLTAWQGSIWRTRQSINGSPLLPLLQTEEAVVGNPPIPNDTMEQNLLSVFPLIIQPQGQGPQATNSVGWNEGGVYKSIYRTIGNPAAAIMLNGVTIGGKRKKSRRKSRKKSRKRKQKGGKRKAKRRKSRKKRGGAPNPTEPKRPTRTPPKLACANKSECPAGKVCVGKKGNKVCLTVQEAKDAGKAKTDARAAAKAAPLETVGTSSLTTPTTPEEKVETVDPNEGEGSPEIIPAGEGEKILKELAAKKKKEETTPAAVTSVETTPAGPLPPKSCANKSECDAGQICFGKKGSKVCGTVDEAKKAGKAKTVARGKAAEAAVAAPQVDTSTLTTPAVVTPVETTPAVVTPVETTPAAVVTPVETTPAAVVTPEADEETKIMSELEAKKKETANQEESGTTSKVTTPVTSDTTSASDGDAQIDAWGDPDLAEKYLAKADKKLRGLSPEETIKLVQSIYDSVTKKEEKSPTAVAAGGYKKKKKRRKTKTKTKRKNKRNKNKSKKHKKRR